VVRMDFENLEGIAVSNGILPRYGDVDAYQMSAGAFDEAVRQIISVGGVLPNLSNNNGIFWSVNDNFCVPDSEYNPTSNPDGKEKLAKLVQMCEALYDMATYFDIPLTSGKDSMKNDLKADGVKISVPPTILYSMAAKIQDVSKVVTSEFKAAGDLVYQLGETYSELGCSEFHRLFGATGNAIPQIRKDTAKQLYIKVMEANAQSWIVSNHDLSDGGLAVTLAECCFGGNLGADVTLDNLPKGLNNNDLLFSESHSRFVVSIRLEHKNAFEAHFGNRAFYLGKVTDNQQLSISVGGKNIVSLNNAQLQSAWDNGLGFLGVPAALFWKGGGRAIRSSRRAACLALRRPLLSLTHPPLNIFTQQTSLHYNQSGKYEDRWCHCKVNPNSKTPFLKDLDVIPLPVRHGEGRLIFANDDIRQQVQAQALNCLTYCTADGTPSSEYPINPNGAELNCAGLCDSTGQVFGLMPHPEAFLSLYNHPNWGNIKRHNADVPEEGLGLKIFKNIVEHVSSVTLHV
jgi:hypothetical protein